MSIDVREGRAAGISRVADPKEDRRDRRARRTAVAGAHSTSFQGAYINLQQGSVLETLRQVHAFPQSNAAVAGSTTASSRHGLDDEVVQLTSHPTAQESRDIANGGEKAR
jgi:hypothetical protein